MARRASGWPKKSERPTRSDDRRRLEGDGEGKGRKSKSTETEILFVFFEERSTAC